MLNDISELIIIKDQITAEFDKASEHLSALLKGEQKATAHVLFMHMGTTSSILDSIFLCTQGNSYYGICILYRSLLEHFLRFQFFFINLAVNKRDDTYSRRFMLSMELHEKLELAKAINVAEGMKKYPEKTSVSVR